MSKTKYCCKAWEEAREPGTDNEGYACLLWRHEADNYWHMGSDDMPIINYCPWCGTKVNKDRIDV